MMRALTTAATETLQRVSYNLFRIPPSASPQLCLASIPVSTNMSLNEPSSSSSSTTSLWDSIWNMAVPKSKVSRSKKRMKTTLQKRIPLKKNIVIDERTGELTLKHKLPFNWKDYLPDEDGK